MRSFALSFALALSAASIGCGPGANYGKPVHNAERATVAGTEVSDDAFANAVRDLLASEPGSRERTLRLTGVVARQVTRVSMRFRAKDRDRALTSLSGAMYLVRSGELVNEILGPNGYDAFKNASEDLAKKGDEGRARASYEILARVAPTKERADIKGHLDAISSWTKDTAGGGTMQTAGALEAAAVTRHLLEPSKEARDEAVTRTIDFIEKADMLRKARRTRNGPQISRDEGLEAVRALETGATVLASIYLRNADVKGALAVLDKSAAVKETARPELVRALAAVADHPDSDHWLDLARMLRPPQHHGGDGDEEDFGRDIELLRVASFTAACEAYRLDATSAEAAAIVAATLVDLGMGEAAPAVLVDAVKTQKDPRMASLGLAVTIQAMTRALEAEEPDSARRTFHAAAPLLTVADGLKGKVQPGPARVLGLMGDIEIGVGNLDEARRLLGESEKRESSGSALLNLARLDWHAKKNKEALDRLRIALGTEDGTKDATLRGEILLLTSDITRDAGGDASAARKSLADALRDLARARAAAEAENRARVEVLISRVLDRFGAGDSAKKALDRALEAAPHDKRQAATTIGQIVGRAFVRSDLASARDGLDRGLAAELNREDIVYCAIWVRILERQMRMSSDAAERVLLGAADDPRWVGKVAAFGAGKIKASELVAAAQTPTQKTEATFYAAMDKKVNGDTKGADEGLRQVVGSPGLDLMEVGFARELLSGGKANVGGPVPEVGLP